MNEQRRLEIVINKKTQKTISKFWKEIDCVQFGDLLSLIGLAIKEDRKNNN